MRFAFLSSPLLRRRLLEEEQPFLFLCVFDIWPLGGGHVALEREPVFLSRRRRPNQKSEAGERLPRPRREEERDGDDLSDNE